MSWRERRRTGRGSTWRCLTTTARWKRNWTSYRATCLPYPQWRRASKTSRKYPLYNVNGIWLISINLQIFFREKVKDLTEVWLIYYFCQWYLPRLSFKKFNYFQCQIFLYQNYFVLIHGAYGKVFWFFLNQSHLHSLREKTQFQENRIEELQQRLYQGKKALTSREVQIQELEHKVGTLRRCSLFDFYALYIRFVKVLLVNL